MASSPPKGDISYERSEDDAPPTLSLITQIALTPIRAATSPTALRTYLRVALVLFAAAALYFIAAVAYIVFYNTYVPDNSFIIPVHLQFDQLGVDVSSAPLLHRPYAVADVAASSDRSFGRQRFRRWFSADSEVGAGSTAKPGRMISGLEYDVDVVMTVPRTPENIANGNFMLELSMLARRSIPPTSSTPQTSDSDALVVAHSSRPATLTYTSPLLAHAIQLFTIPLYILNLRSESETLRVPMLERISFPSALSPSRAPGIPEQLRLELKSRERLQVYAVTVHVQARFSGLRWLMSRHRIASFAFFTAVFWCAEMATALVVWAAAALLFSRAAAASSSASSGALPNGAGRVKGTGALSSSSSEEAKRGRAARVKREDDDAGAPDLSDTERAFPTFSRQPPLRYSPPPRVKREEDEEEQGAVEVRALDATAIEADDEDEDFIVREPDSSTRGTFNDSGIGTSLESSAGAASGMARRRRSNK